MSRTARWSLALLLALAASVRDARAADDPFEAFNRQVFAFNQAVRAHALTPLARAYLELAPPEMRDGVRSALFNLREPVTALSAVAAGKAEAARDAVARFAVNSTIGVFGTVDRATELGYGRHSLTLGDAFCAWGASSGPYLVLPLLGSTTLRDAGADLIAGAAISAVIGGLAYGAASGVDALHAYADAYRDAARLEADAVDLYALHRSVYFQRRARSCAVDEARLRQEMADSQAFAADE